jgi:hypothetical protein
MKGSLQLPARPFALILSFVQLLRRFSCLKKKILLMRALHSPPSCATMSLRRIYVVIARALQVSFKLAPVMAGGDLDGSQEEAC